MSDESVQGTNDDAAISKLSAVTLGYYKDPTLKYFIASNKASRRSPLINRGYYARVAAVYRTVKDFLGSDLQTKQRQVISLGAGFDTLFMRLQDEKAADGKALLQDTRYVEMDFAVVLRRKALLMAKNGILSENYTASFTYESERKKNGDMWSFTHQSKESSCSLHLCGVDLRDTSNVQSKLEAAGIRFDIPTLILSECVLVYVDPVDSGRLIHWLACKFGPPSVDPSNEQVSESKTKSSSNDSNEPVVGGGGGAVFVAYEQINPFDRFGQTMLAHLRKRGASLRGLEAFPDIPAQRKRYLSLGWSHHAAWNMNDIYRYFLDENELRRVEKLELFDEFEEWHIINDHYCISMASLDTVATQGKLRNIGFMSMNKEKRITEQQDAFAAKLARAQARK